LRDLTKSENRPSTLRNSDGKFQQDERKEYPDPRAIDLDPRIALMKQ